MKKANNPEDGIVRENPNQASLEDAPESSLLEAIYGHGRYASDIAQQSDRTPEQSFRRFFKAGLVVFEGEGAACRQVAIQACKAVSGHEAITPRKHGKVEKVARYLVTPAAKPNVDLAIQNQARRIKGEKFIVHDWPPAPSEEDEALKLSQAMEADPDLFVLVTDRLESVNAGVDCEHPSTEAAMLHESAVSSDVTLFTIGEASTRPAGAGIIRVTRLPGKPVHRVAIEQAGMPEQVVFLLLDGGARLRGNAETVSDSEVLEYLRQEGGADVKLAMIRDRFKLSTPAASAIVKRLTKAGTIEPTSHGHYAAVMSPVDR